MRHLKISIEPVSVFAFSACVLAAMALAPDAALADEQAAVNGCIDQVRTVGGPDAQAGVEILSKSWSQAGTLVTMRDAGGTEWECIGYDDGAVGDLKVTNAADDGGGSMSGASGQPAAAPANRTERVQFASGTTGATYSADLGSGDAIRYELGARNGQFLTVELRGNSEYLNYIIHVPDGDILFESSQGGYTYNGQLYVSGDHVVEVFFNGNQGTVGSYDILFEIK